MLYEGFGFGFGFGFSDKDNVIAFSKLYVKYRLCGYLHSVHEALMSEVS